MSSGSFKKFYLQTIHLKIICINRIWHYITIKVWCAIKSNNLNWPNYIYVYIYVYVYLYTYIYRIIYIYGYMCVCIYIYISPSHLKKAGDLLNSIKNINMKDKILANLDIQSLYINVLVKKSIDILKCHLEKN